MATTAELLERLKQKKAQYSRSNNKTVKLKEGKTRIRIVVVPGLADDDHMFGERDLGVHWIKTSQKGKPIAVVGCKEIVYGKPSDINPVIEKAAAAAADDETMAIIKDWKARKSVLVNALIRDGVDKSEDPQVLELTPTTWGAILSVLETYIESGRTDVLEPATGIDFIIERRGKGMDTEYTVMPAPVSQPFDGAKAIAKAVNLDEFIANEWFRGEERKAIAAMTALVGIDGPALVGPRTTALLTGAKPVEPTPATPASIAPPAAPAAPVAPPAPPAAPVETADEREMREMEEKLAAMKAAKAAPAAPVAPPATPAVGSDFGAPLPQDEIDEMLAGLNDL